MSKGEIAEVAMAARVAKEVARQAAEVAQKVAERNDAAIQKTGEILIMMARFEEKLDNVFEQTKKTNGTIIDHEKRIRAAEEVLSEQRGGFRLFTLVGGGSAIGAILSVLASKLWK